MPEHGGAEALREGVVAAADIDRGDLAVVTDVDYLATGRINRALQGEAGAGGTHRGLVEDHDHTARQLAAAVTELDQEPVDGGGVGDAGGHRELVRGGRRGCNADDRNAGGVEGGAVGAERGGLAGPGLADDDVDARRRTWRACGPWVRWSSSRDGCAARTWSTVVFGMRATPPCWRRMARWSSSASGG
ncbi:MAG TPA: hypothetical protein VFZ70_11295 [Euzebyales bacterium]